MASEKQENTKKEMIKNETGMDVTQKETKPGTGAGTKPGTGKAAEPVYTVEEFCGSAQKLFGVRPECIRAAFREKGVMQCGRTEAERMVRAFMKKEVE